MKVQVNPTRMELLRLKKRLRVAVRGHKLLKDKLDELMKNFLELVEENRRLRTEVEEGLTRAFRGFAMARAVLSWSYLETALGAHRDRRGVTARPVIKMNIEIPHFVLDEEEPNMYPYGLAETTGDLDEAVRRLHSAFRPLIQLAEVEKTVELMAGEIERTRRRVNALEYVLIPQLEEQVRYITMKLEENERGNLVRLMKVKEIVGHG
ncbi:MAG TPA: V-type ATP synthase subunit D [Firmicutes bacterium]|jgi:V/A-type H+-transporting ATPase subunit D|nr:V-type ATP synthase subunit D [Bacillota bacterium]